MRSLLEGITSTLRSAQQHQTGWDPRNATSTGVPTTAQEAFSGGVPAVAQRDLSHVEGSVSSKGGASMDCITGYSRFSTHSPPDFPFRMLMITQNVGAIGDTAAGAKEGGEEHRRECEKQAGNDELSSDAQKDVREFLSELRLLIFEYSRREYTAHIRVSSTGDDDPSHPSAADIGGQGPPPLIDVIVVHFQEIGGKSFHTEFNNYFANALQELLPEAGWTSGLLMRTNDDEDQFTAVGSVVYLSHRMCPISSILSFHHRTFVCVGDDPVTYGSSPTILFHGGKFSGAGESRKGYLLISLRLGTVVVNFLNVHLYNDKKSKEAAAASPSPYALQRQEALLETLAECAAFISPDDPLFIFGDFNTRLDVHNMLQYLKEVENLDVKVSDGDVRAPDSFWELFENPQHMGVIRPYDVEVQRLLDVVAQQSGMELAEFAVRFPPTYLCQSPRDSEEATFQIDTPVHLVNDGEDKRESGTSDRISVVRVLERLSSIPHHPYGRRRVPAWCDRVLWNPPALELMTGRRTSQSVAGSSATAHGGTGVGALRRYVYRSVALRHTDHAAVTLFF
ncbi:inositol-1,4,5-trisphosphate (IP3) 5-phosphatase,putative [Trypanosoma brucei gambiense DAL972]|uniref:Inositol-1,4,5-trisphosphate (IP3) 5-phosphatase,putative n=1 Tax=Trypanosoma brucei gambiense (strain MHOM/CI/86/DAL972) TaxID=679716 RepID=D0A7D8_TRYB9|nr:inositol-1,4,5-trisphosphate (IP3) 5-phosphatase,putative [Trypanosoma brucei gambiense DAL972]CBH17589.1 inositol-1,4,5-trisphosphate (IP3) 5-phosphatase,putative [Trypanosoma brucei gambiense DAL972]|eukprot:XP_011779853.1 inositol-1,4,5-trisphosphate (IP3) 5-phosphatase,putative [Trypanosoma brucei gambiense DAL972]